MTRKNKLIVGLGNPGEKYTNTRHNIGFQAVEYFVASHQQFSAFVSNKKTSSLISIGEVTAEERIIVIKPQTFMNESGMAVSQAMSFFDIDVSDTLVLHDDADIEIGQYKLVSGGSGAGHKGVASINNHIGEAYHRCKIGVSNEHRPPGKAIDFVLKQFSLADEETIAESNIFQSITDEILKF